MRGGSWITTQYGAKVIQTEEIYFDCGKRAGQALTDNDFHTYRFESSWYRQSFRLESFEDKPNAKKYYTTGFGLTFKAPVAHA